jgi:Dockerin type I domain/PEP-CTERM motif
MRCRLIAILLLLLATPIAPAATLDDLWSDEARFQIEPIQIAADVQNMHFISMFWDDMAVDPHFKAYYIDAGYCTGLATSYDGVHFTDRGTVLQTGESGNYDDRMAAFSSVFKDDVGIYHLVYEAAGYDSQYPGDVAYASSTDGINFAKQGIILPHDISGGSFERANNGTPSLYKEDGLWYLYYHGFDGDDCQVGLATGTDLNNLSRVAGNPIIPTEQTGWDSGTMGKRSRPIKQGDYWYMAVEGSTDQPYTMAQWSTGVVRSQDLVDWEKCPLGNLLPQTDSGMSFDGSDMVQIGGETYIYYRGPGNNSYRAKLVDGSADSCPIVVADSDIGSDFRYTYELDAQSMVDSSKFDADRAASSGIGLNPVGSSDPVPYFYATSGETDAYLEFRFDFSKTEFRATSASIRDVVALFRIIESPQDTTVVTQWSGDGVNWNTIRELGTPDWNGQAVGASSQGTVDCQLAGEDGLCDALYYRVYFNGDEQFGWNWNQWNRGSENLFRVECDVVNDDYVSITSDFELGEDRGTLGGDHGNLAWPYRNFGHIAIEPDDPNENLILILDFDGAQSAIDDLIAELLSMPTGVEYISAIDLHPLLVGTDFDLLLEFAAPESGSFDFNWDLAGHEDVIIRQIEMVTELPVPGDCNGDRRVTTIDLATVTSNWGRSVTGGVSQGDFNFDGWVTTADLAAVTGNWQYGVVSVPEPSTIGMILIGIAMTLVVRRRN